MEFVSCTPKMGDIVRTKVKFYYHYGIFVSEDEVIQFGLADNVNRPANEIFVLSSDVYTFMGEGSVEVGVPDRKEKKKMKSVNEIVSTARARIGEGGYNLLHNNCEHFVNECVFSTHESSFVDNIRSKIREKLNKD